MINQILIYIGGAITLVWGIAHLFPTKSIIKGFGDISTDNKHIITMEWIVESAALIFIGFIIIGVTIINPSGIIAAFIYLSAIGILLVLAIISIFTGYKVKFIAFKLCPYMFSSSAVLIFLGYTL